MASTPAEGIPKTDAYQRTVSKGGKKKRKNSRSTYIPTNIVYASSTCNLFANELESSTQHVKRYVDQWFRHALAAFHQEPIDKEIIVQEAEIQWNQTG